MTTVEFVRRLEDETADASDVRRLLRNLLATDPPLGASTALGILSREPRVKPSRRLLIDPYDDVFRRWRHRVEAAAALLDAPGRAGVEAELFAELAEDHALARDARAATESPAGRDG